MSEEIKAKIDEDRLRLVRIARLQIKQKLKAAGLLRPVEEIEEEAAMQKQRKGKKEAANSSGNKKNRVAKSPATLTQELEQPAEQDKRAVTVCEIPTQLLGKREADQQIVIEFDSSAVIAEEEAAKSRKLQEQSYRPDLGKSLLNSTHDVTLQNRPTVLFGDDDQADNLFQINDSQDELMHARPAKPNVSKPGKQHDKDVEMLFGNDDADDWT